MTEQEYEQNCEGTCERWLAKVIPIPVCSLWVLCPLRLDLGFLMISFDQWNTLEVIFCQLKLSSLVGERPVEGMRDYKQGGREAR